MPQGDLSEGGHRASSGAYTGGKIIDRVTPTYNDRPGLALKDMKETSLSILKKPLPLRIAQYPSELVERYVCADNDLHLLEHAGKPILGTALPLQAPLIPSQGLHESVTTRGRPDLSSERGIVDYSESQALNDGGPGGEVVTDLMRG